jgi:predicted nucleic acid-binding protein
MGDDREIEKGRHSYRLLDGRISRGHELMIERVVCNASPLIFLAKLQKLDLLNNYDLHIPSQVEAEIIRGLKNKRDDAKQIIEYLKSRKIEPAKVTIIKDLPNFMGSGERAVISLAARENINRVFIDEAKARTVARFKGLKPKGTLGILWDSFKSGGLDKESIELLTLELIQKGYRIKEEILVEFLKKLKRV